MQEQKDTSMRIGRSHAKVLLEWFMFQEQCDTRIEPSSIHIDEIKFSNKLNAIVGKLKKHRKGSFVNINTHEATMAYNWFQNLPQALLGKKDLKMLKILKTYFQTLH